MATNRIEVKVRVLPIKPEPAPLMLHILDQGVTLCRFTHERPVNWPSGHVWFPLSLAVQIRREEVARLSDGVDETLCDDCAARFRYLWNIGAFK